MPGLNPGIHATVQRKRPFDWCSRDDFMDRRVKPGDDGGERG
jgi:hypothetical protein